MINLNEEIDLVLEGSFLEGDQFYLDLLLEADDRRGGPGQDAIEYMVDVILDYGALDNAEKLEYLHSMKTDLQKIKDFLDRNWERQPRLDKLNARNEAGAAEEKIVNGMKRFVAKWGEKFVDLVDDDHIAEKLRAKIIGKKTQQNSYVYRTKHIQSALWGIQHIGPAIEILEEEGEEEGTGTGGEPEETTTGTDDEEETTTDTGRPEMSPEDKEEVAKMLHKASEILAIRALNTKDPGALVNKYGRLLRKYFIVYRAPKAARTRTAESKSKETGIIEEMFLVEEPPAPAAAAPAPSAATAAVDRAGRTAGREDDAFLDALTDEIEVPLEMAKESLDGIEKAYKKYIEVHKRKLSDANYKARFMGMRYLMLRAAGREASGIKSEPSIRPDRFTGIRTSRARVPRAPTRSARTPIGTTPALREGKLVNMVLDLEKLKSNQLDEGYLSMFGAWIEYFLNGLFGGWTPPVAVKGSQRDVEAFARALSGEKRYIETARRYGLDHPTTYKNKAKLDNAIRGFEGDTGIKWPFK